MQYRYVGEIKKPISKVVFGCAIDPMLKGQDCTELLDYVASCGITTFDTAENYGQSEQVLGSWLKNKNREDYWFLYFSNISVLHITPFQLKPNFKTSFT